MSGKSMESLTQLRSLHLRDLFTDTNLFSDLLKSCQSSPHSRQLHALLITSNALSNRFAANHLLHLYSKLRLLRSAHSLFLSIPHKNTFSYNILLTAFIRNNHLTNARHLFDQIPLKNLASWNAMLAGLTHSGFDRDALQLFTRMSKLYFRPDQFTLGSVLRCSAGIQDIRFGSQVHACTILSGFESDTVVASSLAHMYMQCGWVAEAETVLQALPLHNVITCNTLISGRTQNGDPEGALTHFTVMKAGGLAPDHVTFVSTVTACSDLAALAQGQQMHGQLTKSGVDAIVPVWSSLVTMYSKCGCLADAARVFSNTADGLKSDLVLWSAMIAAYGFHGHGEEAIRLFDEMVGEGAEPGDVTFLSLLYACGHSGLKEKGMEYFALMTEKYAIAPSLKHYTCVVDLLGRSGCLDEAEALIRKMPVRADGVIWKTLLSACKTHKNMEMAERVANHLLALDPQDSAAYVLLSNIRAKAEKWGDVSKVREAMKGRRLRKEPGISWMELKGQVHQFTSGDREHPKQREIAEYLTELMGKIKERGYVPETSMVLHDMEDEEKQCSLADHSEKLAIAFGILSLPEGAPIRIMKNLRVCIDCHSAIKIISEITDREIIVRDVSRFHHFRGGKCSCGDYW